MKGMRRNLNVNEIASLGSNVKPVIQNENCSILMLNDMTGEGVMTIYRVLPGVMICFSNMHMEQCVSEFEFKNDRKIFCIDHCREGRIEMEVKPGVFSIMQENELRLDNRENHKGTTYYPLKHYHGFSIFMEVAEVQKALDEMFHGFSVSIEELRSRYCSEEKPYVICGDKELESILSGFYQKNMAHPELTKAKEYYQIKVVELLLYLNTITAEGRKEVRPYYYKTQMEKIKGIHAQITGNPQTRFTIEELSSMYEIPLTTMKKCFKDVYGDSIYSYQKRYRMNLAANMLLQDNGRNRHRASGYRACLCNRCNTARPVPRPRRHRRGPPRSLQGAKAPYIWPASFCNTSRQSCSHGFQRLSPVPLDGAAGHSHHRADLAVRQFQDTMQYQDALSRLGQAGKGSGHQPVADLKLTAIGRKYKTVAGVLIYRA